MKSPIQTNGPLLSQWRGLTRNSDMPSDAMAQHAVRLIHDYAERGVPRFQFRLPMFPGDSSYKITEPDETGAIPPSTAQILGFKPEAFVQFIQ